MTTYKDHASFRTRYGRPSFFRGFAGALDFFGTLKAVTPKTSGWQADAEALAQDWEQVGKDLQAAFDRAGYK